MTKVAEGVDRYAKARPALMIALSRRALTHDQKFQTSAFKQRIEVHDSSYDKEREIKRD